MSTPRLPKDWHEVTLTELGAFKNGINKGSDSFGHGFPFVNLMDVFGVAKIGDATTLGLIDSSKTERRTYDLREGDVLFVRSSVKPSGVGLTTLVTSSLPDAVFSGFLLRFRSDGRLANSFKAYLFSEAGFRTRVIGASTVSANTNINQRSLGSLTVRFPQSKAEQDSIAQALADADGLIASLERLTAKKQAIKQGMMQQLLTGRTRLPGFNSQWSWITVGEVSEFLTGYPFESASFAAAGVRLIRGSNVKRGQLDWSPEIAVYWAKRDPGLRAFALRDGDIVIAMDGALVGRSFARVTDGQLPAYLVQRVARLRGKAVDQDLLYQWISSQAFSKHVDDVKTHTAIPHISPRDIRDFRISIAVDANEQRALADVLGDADLQIQLLKSRLTKARAIKTGMMQQLLTGRIRLVMEAAS